MELIFVPFALFALATPLFTIYLLIRQHKLRQKIDELEKHSTKQSAWLHEQILELRRKMAAAPSAVESTAEPAQEAPQRATSLVPPKDKPAAVAVHSVEPEAKPVPSVAAVVEKPPIAAQRSQPAFCAWCGTVHAGGVGNCPLPAAPVAPAASRPVDVVLGGVHAEPKPVTADVSASLPHAVASVTPTHPPQASVPMHPAAPPSSVSPPPPVPAPPRIETPHLPPRPVAPVVLAASARVVAPPRLAEHRVSAPKATSQQRMKKVFALEEALGTNWLNKLGIIILVLGVALFGIYEFGQLGAGFRVGLSYAVSLTLLVGGALLEKRERYRVLGHTLIGGAWALLFFSTYALNHVTAMHVLDSEPTDLILMLAVALAMVGHTLRYRSQLVTGLSFLLAYGTVALSHDNVYSLLSGVILAVGLVSIVVKMEWFELEVFGILASYLSHLYWLYRALGAEGAQGHAFPEYNASTGLLLFYWLIYRISYVIRKTKSPFAEHVSTAAALINTLFLLGTMKFQSVHPEYAFVALLVIGASEFSFGQLPITKRRREAFIVLSVLGTALMIGAVPSHFTGNNVAILWLIGAEVFLLAGVLVGEIVFRRLGLLTGLLVGLHLAAIDFMQLITIRNTSENLVLGAGVLFGVCAVVFYSNALGVGRKWKEFFGSEPDGLILTFHSYLGGFAAAAAAWAICSYDWTALGFAAVMLALAALDRQLKSAQLRAQCVAIGALTAFRAYVVNLHFDGPPAAHIQTRLLTLPLLAAAFYLAAKWTEPRADGAGLKLRGLFAAAGTALIVGLIYFEVPELWQPVAGIAFAVLLLECGGWMRYRVLTWHTHGVSALAVLAAVTADQAGAHRWQTMPVHAFAALPVVLGAYWIAKRVDATSSPQAGLPRIAYTWVGSALVVWGINETLHAPWTAVGGIIFAVLLARSTRWIRYQHLAWQADTVAACAVAHAYAYNFPMTQAFAYGVSLRLVTVVMVAAGLYLITRKPLQQGAEYMKSSAYLLSAAGTALLALLAWYEAPGGWLAAVWAVFALVLAVLDRRFELDELGWQAHALAGLAVVRSVMVNVYVMESWHGYSVRLLSLTMVAIVLYALSRVVRMPEAWRKREFHHVYSWAASAIVSLLIWYELQPLSIAIGWAVFGLVLFELGLFRKIQQFRFQAYVALTAAFARIFFANLTAGDPAEFWGPRMFTVLPLALIFFFVYAQLGPDEQSAQEDRRLRFDTLLAYLGTGSVVAALYFQYPNDWLVTTWAGVAFVLCGLALVLDRPIFLHQGLLLTVGVCGRGIAYNCLGASYFSGGDWTGRYGVLGSAVVILLACLPFAFLLRKRYKAQAGPEGWLGALVRRPEQLLFFAPIALLTLMIALKMRAGMVTVAWGIEGVGIIVLALLVNVRSYRLTGLSMLLLCVGKVLVKDAWGLAPRDRYLTFIVLGAALLLVSFLYTKYRDTIRQFL